jgi:hypothetical protein
MYRDVRADFQVRRESNPNLYSRSTELSACPRGAIKAIKLETAFRVPLIGNHSSYTNGIFTNAVE